MRIQIESPHVEIDRELASQIRAKFNHLGKRYDRIECCDVVLKREKSDKQQNFFVEVKMDVPGKVLFASDKAETFEMALEKVVKDLEHQLNRHKEEIEEVR